MYGVVVDDELGVDIGEGGYSNDERYVCILLWLAAMFFRRSSVVSIRLTMMTNMLRLKINDDARQFGRLGRSTGNGLRKVFVIGTLMTLTFMVSAKLMVTSMGMLGNWIGTCVTRVMVSVVFVMSLETNLLLGLLRLC